jgi:hypothetical protein
MHSSIIIRTVSGLRTPFSLGSDVKMRAELKRTSVVKMLASTSLCSSYVWHTSVAILIACYQFK